MKVFSLKTLIHASSASLNSRLTISVNIPISEAHWDLFMRSSFPSHAIQVVLISPSSQVDNIHRTIVHHLNPQCSSLSLPWAGAQGKVCEIERLNYLIAFRGIARVRTEGVWRGTPLALVGPLCMSGPWAGKLWTQRLKASILCLADEEIVLEWAITREQSTFPSVGATQD